MRIRQLIERSGQAVRIAPGPGEGGDVEVRSIVDDSRQAGLGAVFVARSGIAADGRRFISDAIERGAVAVLTDEPLEVGDRVALLLSDRPLQAAAEIARTLHNDPASRLQLIGVTGTNGKTTTASLVRHLLNAAGRRCGLIGTIEVDTGRERRPAALTTPGRLEMIALLAEMAEAGCDAAVMEVSSHALDQGRVDGLGYAAGVFTNLSGDHLDYHGTMEAYAAAKARLMQMLPADGAAIINAADAWHQTMLQDCDAKALMFSVAEAGATGGLSTSAGDGVTVSPGVLARVVDAGADGTRAVFAGPWGEFEATLPLIGRHNVANMAAAVCVAHAMGVDVNGLGNAIATCPQVPGRLERVAAEGVEPGFEAIVDYAHTDDALENVLRAVRPITPNRLRVVFGCGGDRDPAKRPRMARWACELADVVWVTSDNPRTEDPQKIIDDILAGVSEADRPRVRIEPDRRAAIEGVITEAEPGDVVLIAGKGHEDYQIVGEQTLHFDDREVTREALARRLGAGGSLAGEGERA